MPTSSFDSSFSLGSPPRGGDKVGGGLSEGNASPEGTIETQDFELMNLAPIVAPGRRKKIDDKSKPSVLSFTSSQNSKGTYSEEVGGEESMLLEPEVPGNIFTTPKVGNSKPKFRMFCAPTDLSELRKFCFGCIGSGSTMCLRKNCTVNHEGPKIAVVPGDAFIKKSKFVAFAAPSANLMLLDDSIIDSWMSTAEPLDEWSSRLDLVKSKQRAQENQVITYQDLKEEIDFKKRAKSAQSARKRKFDNADPVSEYFYSSFKDDPELQEMGPTEVRKVLMLVDDSIGTLSEQIRALSKQQSDLVQDLNQDTVAVEELALGIASVVGDKPKHFDFPTVWSCLCELKETLDLHPRRLQRVASQFDSALTDVKSDVNAVRAQVDSSLNSLRSVLKKFGNNSSLSFRNLTDRIEDIEAKQMFTPVDSHPQLPLDLVARVEAIERSSLEQQAGSRRQAVKFNDMGFFNMEDASKWLESVTMDDDFGYVVDVHTVCMHLHIDATEKESMATRMYAIKRVDVKTFAQEHAMSSFEHLIPRLFSSASAFKIFDDDASHLDAIASYSKWILANYGFRDVFLASLSRFESAHTQRIHSAYGISGPMYSLAILALKTSVSWLEAFVRFIDETMKEYTQAKFSETKAFNVTTRLAKSLLLHIAEPRQGVSMNFQATNIKQIKQLVFYHTLLSLDKMVELQTKGFSNSAVTQAELVKFLSKNTQMDAIQTLKTQTGSLGKDVSNLRKELKEILAKVNETNKLANSTNNKIDLLKSTVDSHSKRLTKLEHK